MHASFFLLCGIVPISMPWLDIKEILGAWHCFCSELIPTSLLPFTRKLFVVFLSYSSFLHLIQLSFAAITPLKPLLGFSSLLTASSQPKNY
jgi:hypothetical protein